MRLLLTLGDNVVEEAHIMNHEAPYLLIDSVCPCLLICFRFFPLALILE